ncbi:MAG: alpha/beta hydrolase [Parvularculaceae bacterium]
MTNKFRGAIAELGNQIGPDVMKRVHEILFEEQQALAEQIPMTAGDVPYGDDPRQTLDVYAPKNANSPCPVLVFVHGGGFVRGEKRAENHPFNAHMGRFAAANGMLGVVMNYRLAPDNVWPSGVEDLAKVVAWINETAEQYGGDAKKIILCGTSAGAAHVADYIHLKGADNKISAAIMLSGLYGGVNESDLKRESLYYVKTPQEDPTRYSFDAIAATDIPFFTVCGEFDPPRFQREFNTLLAARLKAKEKFPRAYIASGHNHFSTAYHIGTSDTRLADEILEFISISIK